MNEKEKKELTANLKGKRYRKYILTALAVFICVSAVAGISIEGKDAKLPDGQGNIVTDRQDDSYSDADSAPDSDTEKSERVENITDDGTESSTDGSEAKKEAEKQEEELSRLTDEEKEKIDPSDVKVDNSEDFTASNGGNAALRPKEPKPVTVTLEISYTPLYESYYIEGINYLYEFDGGNLSGWMYKVNGWFPNYGCSSYYLSDGDVIEWVYTCDLGKDVGDNSMS